MKILGIEASTKFLCIGIYIDGLFYEYNLETAHKLSKVITISLKRILKALNLKLEDLNYFACGLGPGSFTGMRVVLSTIKGLSWSMNKPVIGISTLDILAMNVGPGSECIMPLIDAKRQLVYTSIFRNKSGTLDRIAPYMLLSKDELINKIKPDSIVFGDGLNLYKDEIGRLRKKNIKIVDKDFWYPNAGNLLKLAVDRAKKFNAIDVHNIKPIYLYPKECQIKSR